MPRPSCSPGNGADVINISSSSNSGRESVMEHAAIRYAVRRGAVVVASAGNDAAVPARYPAAYPEVISVTAADADGGLAAWAAWKGGIDVAAPGAQVVTTVAGGGYVRASGTSFAAPYVAGVVARMKAADPRLTPAEIERILVETARAPDGSRGKSQTLPAVDPAAALAAVSDAPKGSHRPTDEAYPPAEFRGAAGRDAGDRLTGPPQSGATSARISPRVTSLTACGPPTTTP
ncbi:hypothetical protein BH23ACT7_BH23ACT7_06860 [soil metagenome]